MKLPVPLTVDSLETAYSAWQSEGDPSLSMPVSLPSPLPFCIEGPLLQQIASASRKFGQDFFIKLTGLNKESKEYPIASVVETCKLTAR